MKFSQALIPTLRQAPADAEVISHQLLIRAGMIRKVANGIYEYLPLGLRSLRKVENIIRDELNKAGCQEVFMPHMVPAEFWQQSGRWQKYGKELLRITDRHEREYCFGPTHEEVICEMVAGSVKSYKALPLNLYQIQTKFRDEIRPRFGLMRGREFLMKDGYSFHTSFEDLDREYDKMHATYHNIFKRCGLACKDVDADTGSIGGSSSHEFMVLAETGEDVIATCDSCSYAANLEKATYYRDRMAAKTNQSIQEVSTPNLKSIEDVSKFLKIAPDQMIKTLVYKADESFVVVCLAGGREVSDIKLGHVVTADVIRLASESEVQELTGVQPGFLGPVGLEEAIAARSKSEFKILYDYSVLEIKNAATGANKNDYHLINVDLARDLKLSESSANLCDISNVRVGDSCPKCKQGKLSLVRGIEVGHIFKLGKRYSEPMQVNYLDQDGKEKPAIMGTYGIGVGRTMAASIEQNHDEKGIIWPRALAPYSVHLITMDVTEELVHTATLMYDNLSRSGIDVLWDDRDERAGVKFNDADLIGIPLQVVIGKKGLERGVFEYKIRRDGKKGEFAREGGLEAIRALLETI